MTRNKVARRSCSYDTRRNVQPTADTQSITRDVMLGVAGAVVMIGVPFILAVMKQWGWW